VLASTKLVSRSWSGQEQQEPAPIGGAIFQANWWQHYAASTPAWDMVVVSVDCA
jgi:hypothetical protein